MTCENHNNSFITLTRSSYRGLYHFEYKHEHWTENLPVSLILHRRPPCIFSCLCNVQHTTDSLTDILRTTVTLAGDVSLALCPMCLRLA